VNHQVRPDQRIPDSLERLVAGLLAKSRSERPNGMDQVRRELQTTLDASRNQTLPPRRLAQGHLIDRTDAGNDEIIQPVKVSGEESVVERFSLWKQDLLKSVALIIVFLALVVGGGLFLRYLSKNPVLEATAPEEKAATGVENTRIEAPAAETAPKPIETVNTAQLALEKAEAERKLSEFVRLKTDLDSKGAPEWGGEFYAQMMQVGQKADNLLMEGDYTSASSKYMEATAKANELAGQTTETLRRLMDDGRLALAEGEGQTARDKFGLALMIDPTSKVAQHNLERANKVETVMRLLESGKHHERKNNFSFAYADYQEALRVDPESNEARTASARVKGLITEQRFRESMSSGLAAYHRGEYEFAQAELQKAQSFKPSSQEVHAALGQVDEAIRLARIERLQAEALTAEDSEDWERALKLYTAVLQMNQTIQFAVRGKDRSQERLRIDRNIDFYLKKPEFLESDRHLQKAILLLHEAAEIEPKGPRLSRRLDEMNRLVTVAKTPVTVTLESDNLTEVAIYKIGKLGRFEIRQLELRPGTYIVVGARDGYQDVRQEIVVKAGQKQLRVTVKCGAKI
ncbi:MAG: hypothetical protein JSU72_06615, partial [Deltaproteobacteria bacterium]